MNIVSPRFIKDYLLEKFEENYKICSGGRELVVPSIFVNNDYKCHMSINTSTGLWQCFKTGKKGNFIYLYSILEKLTYKKAEAKIMFQAYVYEDWAAADNVPDETLITDAKAELGEAQAITSSNLLSDVHQTEIAKKCLKFILDRKLLNTNLNETTPQFYYKEKSKYAGRLIVPFFNEDTLVFFQARALFDNQYPKYITVEGSKSSHMLYPFDWSSDTVVVTEGPTDAISLQIQGVNATCTMGCAISDIQITQLADFKGTIILGYDNDVAGKKGVVRFDTLRKTHMMPKFKICYPPSEYKDWNDAHVKDEDLQSYVKNYTRTYDFYYVMLEELSTLQ